MGGEYGYITMLALKQVALVSDKTLVRPGQGHTSSTIMYYLLLSVCVETQINGPAAQMYKTNVQSDIPVPEWQLSLSKLCEAQTGPTSKQRREDGQQT